LLLIRSGLTPLGPAVRPGDDLPQTKEIAMKTMMDRQKPLIERSGRVVVWVVLQMTDDGDDAKGHA
jgi:hypothetical protein